MCSEQKKKETQVFFSPVVAMDKFCPNKRQESKGYLHEGTRYTKKESKALRIHAVMIQGIDFFSR